MGNAKSLKGGMLIATPLKGADGEIYALAQGSLVIAGAGAAAGGAGAGQPPERRAASPTGRRWSGWWRTCKRATASFWVWKPRTSRRGWHKPSTAALAAVWPNAMDGRTIRVNAPTEPDARVTFMAELEELPLENSVPSAKVVINARTGSIVMNQAVSLGACAAAHGNLSISITTDFNVSQPNALSRAKLWSRPSQTSRSGKNPAC